jgi:hypothetical protein
MPPKPQMHGQPKLSGRLLQVERVSTVVPRRVWPTPRAGEGNRTPDLLITNEPLCRLSYPGEIWALDVV